MTHNDLTESTLSYWIRRGAGWVSVAGAAIGVIGLLLGRELGWVPLVATLLLPPLVMIVHLAMTPVLSPDEKRVWRGQMVWSHEQFIAVWAYLFAANLNDRTRGFAEYKS